MNPFKSLVPKKIQNWYERYHNAYPERSLRQEWREFIRDGAGRIDPKKGMVAAGFGLYAAGSIGILIWSSKLVEGMKDTKVLAASIAALVMVKGYLLAKKIKNKDEKAGEIRKEFGRMGGSSGAFLMGRMGGHFFPFTYRFAEAAAGMAGDGRGVGATALATASVAMAGIAAATTYAAWKIEKLPAAFSAAIGVCHGTLLIVGAGYVSSQFSDAAQDNTPAPAAMIEFAPPQEQQTLILSTP